MKATLLAVTLTLALVLGISSVGFTEVAVDPPSPTESMEVIVPPGEDAVVEFDDGKLTVTVPTDALEGEAVLTLTLLPEIDWPEIPANASQLAAAFEVLVEVNDELVDRFDVPLHLDFPISPGDVQGREGLQIFVSYWDEALEQWVALPTVLGSENGLVTVTGITDHLTVVTVLHNPDLPVLTDIHEHWAWDDILRMASLGVVRGYPDNTFQPDRAVSRVEFAKMVVDAAGLDIPVDPTLPFADEAHIPTWAKAHVAAAVQAGVIRGYPDDTFRPDATINRAEMAAMLVRAGQVDVVPATESLFPDESPDWALDYINTVGELGFMRGFPDGTFRADANTTRAQSCTVLWRLVDLLSR